MRDKRVPQSSLADTKVNVRILLAMLWVCHFILWIFGDMFTLLQDMAEPADDAVIQRADPLVCVHLAHAGGIGSLMTPTNPRKAQRDDLRYQEDHSSSPLAPSVGDPRGRSERR